MFGKLKDKLKSTLSIFSKKAETEAKEEIIEVELEILEKTVSKKEIAPEPSKDELLDLDADETADVDEHLAAEEEKEEIILEAVNEINETKKKKAKIRKDNQTYLLYTTCYLKI